MSWVSPSLRLSQVLSGEEGRRYGECEVEPPTQSNTGTSYWEQEGGDRAFITVKLEIMMAGLPCLETVGKTEQM